MNTRTRTAGRWALLVALCAGIMGLQPLTSGTTAAPLVMGCGDPLFRPNGDMWTCTFADDFNGTKLDPGKWVTVRTWASGFNTDNTCYYNTPQAVRVGNGALRLTTRRLEQPTLCYNPAVGSFTANYMGGFVSSWQRFSQTYGRFEFRAKFPKADVQGLHSALWLWPVDSTKYGERPASGEIDVAEYFTSHHDRVIPNVHFTGDEQDPTRTNYHCYIKRPDLFHTYLLEWSPRRLRISYDGQLCIVNKWVQYPGHPRTAPFDQPFHVNLTQTIGIGENAVRPKTPLPATMIVDYVRVWR